MRDARLPIFASQHYRPLYCLTSVLRGGDKPDTMAENSPPRPLEGEAGDENAIPLQGPSQGSSQTQQPQEHSALQVRQTLGDKSDTNKSQFVANFLSLEVSFVADLPLPVIDKITARANELAAVKSQQMLDQVSFEQSIHNSNAKVEQMKARLDKALKDAESLESTVKDLETQRAELKQQLSDYSTKESSDSDTSRNLQARIDSISAEKRHTLDTLERRNQELQELRAELQSANAKLLESRKSSADLETQVQSLRSGQTAAQMREHNLRQQLESVKRNSEWLESELNTKSDTLKNFRVEKLARISELEVKVDTLDSEHRSIKNAYESMKQRYSDLSTKYDSSLVQIKDLKNAATMAEEGFKDEMASQVRLSQLWERSAKESKKRVEELEATLDRERNSRDEDLSAVRSQLSAERKRAERLQSQLDTLEIKLQDAHTDQQTPSAAGQIGAGGSGSPRTPQTPLGRRGGVNGSNGAVGIMSPSAQIISDIQRGGGSLVQLYTDYQDIKTKLERERYKNETLRREMDHILEEMENHAPAILAEREENARLEMELAEMSVQLERATSEMDEAKSSLKYNDAKMKDVEKENGLLSQQLRDLSRQVQHLLIQIQMLTDSEPPLNPDEQSALQRLLSSDGDKSDTDMLISQRLVLFKNIIEVQQQNENLLKVTRELGQRMEQQEAQSKKKMEDLESSAVEDAKKAILSLQDETKRMEARLEAMQRERDMFRRMLTNKEGSNEADGRPQVDTELLKQKDELESSLKNVSEEFEIYKTESTATSKALNDEISGLRSKNSELHIQISQTQSKLELASERYKHLNENLELVKSENSELKKRSQSLQEALSKQDIKTQQVVAELVDARSMVESVRSESSNLKAEKTIWKSVEERLTRENSDLIEERGRLNAVISNLQSLEAEHESSYSESKRRLTSQIESLESKVESLEKRLEAESQEVKNVTLRKERDATEFSERIEKLHSENSMHQENLNKLRADYEAQERKVQELESQLQAANEKVSIYKSRGEHSAEEELSEQIASLKEQLRTTRHDLSLSEDHVKEITDVASAAEEALQSLTKTHDEYVEDTEKRIEERQVSHSIPLKFEFYEHILTKSVKLRHCKRDSRILETCCLMLITNSPE